MNEIVITSTYVMNLNKEVTYVSHDTEGIWEFLSNDDVQESDAVVVSLKQITEHDSSLKEILSLPRNKRAFREGKFDNWKIEDLE